MFENEDDPRLQEILNVSRMVECMPSSNGPKRHKTFTKDTATALSQTICCVVDLVKHLLRSEEFGFVMLCEFSTDPLEKAFSRLRQGSGGAYFITVQQVLQKTNIEHAKLLLRYEIDFCEESAAHRCEKCDRQLTERKMDILDNVAVLEEEITHSAGMALVYIAGYLIRKDDEVLSSADTYEYCSKYGKYLTALSRGGLKQPSDAIYQWTMYCYSLFVSLELKNTLCHISLSSYFVLIKEMLEFDIPVHCVRSLANIFLNDLAKLLTPRSSKEPKQKMLKLNSDVN